MTSTAIFFDKIDNFQVFSHIGVVAIGVVAIGVVMIAVVTIVGVVVTTVDGSVVAAGTSTYYPRTN